MKIGILTLPLHCNYGGILQAYAMQTVLKRMGHEVVVINYNQFLKRYVADSPWRRIVVYPWRFINKYVLRRYRGFIQYEKSINESRQYKDKYLKEFIDQHIKYFLCDTLSEIPASTFDAIIVGSDQVWRKVYFSNSERIENAYLAFARGWNIKRIAYAASFGKGDIGEYNDIEKEACKDLIQLFDAVSVREKQGVDICKKEFGVEAINVLDPTLLLDKKDYIKLCSGGRVSNGDLFYYILDETSDIVKGIENYSKTKDYKLFRVNALPEDASVPLEQRIQRPVSEWLYAFASAKEIVTDSFHACVFSIIFNKPFWVLANPNRGTSRIYSLLETFGLQNRILQSIKEFGGNERAIDWKPVNAILNERRALSLNFIIDNLKVPPPHQLSECKNRSGQSFYGKESEGIKTKFSVIIPVYNVKDKIEQCVQSILTQTYRSIEVILVDDGSNDGSSILCDCCASADSRVIVIHKKNGGPSEARNMGLEVSTGDWIMFIDADDILLPGAIEIYNDIIRENDGVEIIRSGYMKIGASGSIQKVAVDSPRLLTSKEDFFLCARNPHYGGFLWNSCYSRNIALQFRMDEKISWCEDHIYTYQCMSVAHKVFFTNALTYKYSYDDIHSIGYGHCLSTKKKDYRMIIKAAEKDKSVKMNMYEGSSDVLNAIHLSYVNKLQIALYYSFFKFRPLTWIAITRQYLDSDYKYLCYSYWSYLKQRIRTFFKRFFRSYALK